MQTDAELIEEMADLLYADIVRSGDAQRVLYLMLAGFRGPEIERCMDAALQRWRVLHGAAADAQADRLHMAALVGKTGQGQPVRPISAARGGLK